MAAIPIPADKIAEFCRRRHIKKLALFGSVLSDAFTPESDVDVLVEFDPGHTPGYGISDVEDELSTFFEGHPVELCSEKALHPLIKDRVLRDAQVIYAE